MNGLQHGALAHTEQQAIKGPKFTSVKPFKRENQLIYIISKKILIISMHTYRKIVLKHAEEYLKERFATIPARTGNSVIVFAGKYECLLARIQSFF